MVVVPVSKQLSICNSRCYTLQQATVLVEDVLRKVKDPWLGSDMPAEFPSLLLSVLQTAFVPRIHGAY